MHVDFLGCMMQLQIMKSPGSRLRREVSLLTTVNLFYESTVARAPLLVGPLNFPNSAMVVSCMASKDSNSALVSILPSLPFCSCFITCQREKLGMSSESFGGRQTDKLTNGKTA